MNEALTITRTETNGTKVTIELKYGCNQTTDHLFQHAKEILDTIDLKKFRGHTHIYVDTTKHQ